MGARRERECSRGRAGHAGGEPAVGSVSGPAATDSTGGPFPLIATRGSTNEFLGCRQPPPRGRFRVWAPSSRSRGQRLERHVPPSSLASPRSATRSGVEGNQRAPKGSGVPRPASRGPTARANPRLRTGGSQPAAANPRQRTRGPRRGRTGGEGEPAAPNSRPRTRGPELAVRSPAAGPSLRRHRTRDPRSPTTRRRPASGAARDRSRRQLWRARFPSPESPHPPRT